MKKYMLWMGLAVMGVGTFGVTGCKETAEQAAAPAAVGQQVEAPAPVAENPDQAKPKDHPAH